MSSISEEELVSLLSGVLLKDEIDGLDEDLVQYIAGLLSTQFQEQSSSDGIEEILDESMIPFLDSVGCPSELQEQTKSILLKIGEKAASTTSATTTDDGQQCNIGCCGPWR